jgi:glycerol-3-phosphate dehydrogenase (NAD(P)+)
MQIGCVGAGSWGTTLAVYLARLGRTVSLLPHSREQVERLELDRENRRYLPGIEFPDAIEISDSIDEVLSSDLVIVATPTQHIRSTLSRASIQLRSDSCFVNTSKGIERGTLLRVSEMITDVLSVEPERIVTLSGPSHAEEVSRYDPAALVAGSIDLDRAILVQEVFSSDSLRIYTTDDIIGVELGGSLKNIIALCAGIVDGLKFGDNTKAALLTRGLAEITRLGVALGARPETFSGLSGLGDLVVTCWSSHSRNRYVGEQLGRGRSLDDVVAEMNMVAEGVATTESALELAVRADVEMPIIDQVHQILFRQKNPRAAIDELMTRTTKLEVW